MQVGKSANDLVDAVLLERTHAVRGGGGRDHLHGRARLYQALYASWLPAHEASLVWALSMVLLFYLVALWMDRRGLYLKV